MKRVVLLHWDERVDRALLASLSDGGFDATTHLVVSAGSLRPLRERVPDAIVIDLDRRPSQGRQVAVLLRQQKWSRSIGLVFVDGEAEKVATLRAVLPDATFATRKTLRSALERTLARPLAAPIVPESIGGYSGTPLPKKLGIAVEARVLLIGAPKGFESVLVPLPDGAVISRRATKRAQRVLLFARTRAELERKFASTTAALDERGSIWIAWPKKTSKLAGDLGEPQVRAFGLARGFVDYKVCAIDADWSGLCFSRRKAK